MNGLLETDTSVRGKDRERVWMRLRERERDGCAREGKKAHKKKNF